MQVTKLQKAGVMRNIIFRLFIVEARDEPLTERLKVNKIFIANFIILSHYNACHIHSS